MRVCLVRPTAQHDQLVFADMDMLPELSHHVILAGDTKIYRPHKFVHIVGTDKEHQVDIYLARMREP